MDLERALARDLLERHPLEAARLLEEMPRPLAAGVLEAETAECAAGVLLRMAPHAASGVLALLRRERATDVVAALPVDRAASVLRRLAPETSQAILAELPPRAARALRSLLRHPEGTAGALMDPGVLALPQDLTAREALEHVRQAAESARYNVYVVDREHRLVGVLNLRELLLAQRGIPLAAIMKTSVRSLPARADRHAIVSDPGWLEVHALPVVDERGSYLGAIRYRTLRRLEEELHDAHPDAGTTARALGELLRAGAAGMLEALASTASASPGGGAAGGSDV